MGDPRPSYLFPHPLKQWLCLELKTVFGGLDRLVTSSSFQCCLSCICALICGITFSVHAGQRKDATCRYIGRVCDAWRVVVLRLSFVMHFPVGWTLKVIWFARSLRLQLYTLLITVFLSVVRHGKASTASWRTVKNEKDQGGNDSKGESEIESKSYTKTVGYTVSEKQRKWATDEMSRATYLELTWVLFFISALSLN